MALTSEQLQKLWRYLGRCFFYIKMPLVHAFIATGYIRRALKFQSQNSIINTAGEVERQTSDLRRQLTSVQSELDNALRRTQEAIKNEQTARSDLQEQVRALFNKMLKAEP